MTRSGPSLTVLAVAASLALLPAGCSSKPDPAVIEALKKQQAEAAKRRRDADTRQQADTAFEKLDQDFKQK